MSLRISSLYATPDIDPAEVEQKGYDTWLGRLHQFLTSDPDLTDKYHYIRTTPHAIQVGHIDRDVHHSGVTLEHLH